MSLVGFDVDVDNGAFKLAWYSWFAVDDRPVFELILSMLLLSL